MEEPRIPNAIEVSAVTKRFGATTAVNDVSLSVPPGQILALLGKNGAGKTTLIDMVLGLQSPDTGRITLWDGTPRQAIKRSAVGVVHQTGALLLDHTVGQMLHLFASTHATALPLDQVLAETNLTELRSRRIGKLSGGEQQRVRLALALLPDPLLLILDEPTAGMDATARREFWDMMATQAERGRTILFATHYLAEAEQFAQRTVIMRDGAIVADAPTDELRRLTRLRTLRALVPTSRRGQVEAMLANSAVGSADFDWKTVDAPPADELELVVRCVQSDQVARGLLALNGVHDLEITSPSLEDAFARLTS